MPSIIEGYTYDIFISYRQKDNKYDGWVAEFVDNLNKELEAAFKEEISVYFDINPSDYLLESYDVDASLRDKLKCLIFIPILSRTYCDPKSFAWDNELKAFIDLASADQFGFKVKLPNGNVANRVLPVRIHDLDIKDTRLFESIAGGVLRSIDFVYKETGVNRQLRSRDDDIIKSTGQVLYRDQINKVALAIKEIIESMMSHAPADKIEEKDLHIEKRFEKKDIIQEDQAESGKVEITRTPSPDKPKAEIEGNLKSSPIKILIPGIFIALIICTTIILLLNHRAKVKWAREDALPEIERYYNEVKAIEACDLLAKAEKYIPDDPKLKDWTSKLFCKMTILTEPPGADIYVREYSDNDNEWKKLGQTPIDSIRVPIFTFYQVKIEKPGYENVIAVTRTGIDTLFRKLFKLGDIPPGMIYVDGYYDEVKNTFDKEHGFFMDKYEVTNKQFKKFIDEAGYGNLEYWKNGFIKEGKTLTWEAAIAGFVDKTGRPGPSTWEGGDYPDGQDDYPVSGLSWYEAAAYAEFAGKDLPTGDHWDSGAGFYWSPIFNNITSRISPISNFNGKGIEPVGKNSGITAFGALDMAGNVREWNWNETGIGRVISGAGYDDASYLFTTWSQLPPFDRSPQNGFRCVKYVNKDSIPKSAFRLIDLGGGRDFSKEKPVPEIVFQVYKNQFLYDKTTLNSIVEERDINSNDWVVEKITFNAAYGEERIITYLFLPKNAYPPYATIIFFPGIYAFSERKLNYLTYTDWFFDYLLKNGRAIMFPVYYGTYERKEGQTPERFSHQYTEWLIKTVKDFSRTIDYLETRTDIDTAKLAYYGHSMGGRLGGIIPAVEKRLSANILIVGGFSGNSFPEAGEINYVSRVEIPTLMLNGRYDNQFPYETTVLPFYNLLGTPKEDKRLCVYETDHYVAKSDMIREVLGWLDKYFGPANHIPEK